MKLYQLFAFALLLFLGCTASKVTQSELSYVQTIENHRKNYKEAFLKAQQSPLSNKDLKHLRFYAADENFKVTAKFTKTENAKPFELTTSSGSKKKYAEYGKATFTIGDTTCTLSLYTSLQLQNMPQYKNLLFVPFKDYTSAETTYGGGRYLDLQTTDIVDNQTIVIDFNKCYNPYCAYQLTGWNCPIPPDENYLKMYIEAGERNFAKEK
jgi:uncharacterized protein (DUF1684 family)